MNNIIFITAYVLDKHSEKFHALKTGLCEASYMFKIGESLSQRFSKPNCLFIVYMANFLADLERLQRIFHQMKEEGMVKATDKF